jgi:hypothetical protein
MIMLLSASLLLICSDAIATAQAPLTNTNVNTKAEQWVNERLRSGKPADLQAKFSERERSISAKCIEDIIRDKGSNGILNNKGMSIANADIVDILDLESLTIRYPIRFNHCNFASNVNFIRSKFCNDLWFYDCTFEAVTSFTSIVVDKDFTIVNCNFVKAGSFCITHGTVNKQLFINDSNFDCDSSFFDNVKLGDLIAFRAKFNGSSVSFIGMTVNKSADFTSAIFLGKTSFNNVIIGNNMIFKNAIFKNNNSKYFQGMQVKGEGNYYDSEINCPMHLEGSSFDTLRLPKEELVKIDHSIHLDYVKYRYICIGNCNINEKPSDNLLHYFNSKCSYHVTI